MKEPILISITGMDRPGITATITQVLSGFDADVLDIGQSVIHDSLSLGMLVQIPEYATDPNIVIQAVKSAVDKLNLTGRGVNISRERYGDWVSQQVKW